MIAHDAMMAPGDRHVEELALARALKAATQATIVVIMPAYNAEKTLAQTYHDLPLEIVDEVIVTDDASRDGTVAVARSLGLDPIVHPRNLGYGGNQKTCYDRALALGADIVVMVHPDHQYDPRLVPEMVNPLLRGECDAVFGSRMLGGRFFEGGMPKWKFYANVLLTAVENVVLETYLTECHSGFRAYSRRYLAAVSYGRNSDGFVFDAEIIIQGVCQKLKIREIPIETRYFEQASQIGFAASVRYGLGILAALLKYKLHRWGLWRFAFLERAGLPSQAGNGL